MEIIGYANHTTEKQPFQKIFHMEDFVDFWRESDFVVNVLPHDESTIGLINKKVLENAKPSMVFVNIGRNSIFSGDDFYDYMKRHRDSIAFLDMFEWIPNPISNKYRRLSNVVVTPRIASVSQESIIRLKLLIARNIQAVETGLELKNRIV